MPHPQGQGSTATGARPACTKILLTPRKSPARCSPHGMIGCQFPYGGPCVTLKMLSQCTRCFVERLIERHQHRIISGGPDLPAEFNSHCVLESRRQWRSQGVRADVHAFNMLVSSFSRPPGDHEASGQPSLHSESDWASGHPWQR